MPASKSNPLWQALLFGRSFTFIAPYPLETCVEKLTHSVVTELALDIRLAQPSANSQAFEICRRKQNKAIGKGKLQRTSANQTRVSGRFGGAAGTLFTATLVGGFVFWTSWAMGMVGAPRLLALFGIYFVVVIFLNAWQMLGYTRIIHKLEALAAESSP